VVTGLLYVDPDAADCHEILDTVKQPLNTLEEAALCPGNQALAGINDSFR
jgi:2-oxoglutarate/2-oxoacid ferredoxin oxidoreductase subunit beta